MRGTLIALTFAAPGLVYARGYGCHSPGCATVELLLAVLIGVVLVAPILVRIMRPAVAWVRDFLQVCKDRFTNL
ncbi:hypothetical protein BC2230_40450 [Burkholderia cepacia]